MMKYLSEEGELVRSESRVQGERGGSAPVEDALVNVLGALDRPEAARRLAQAVERLVHVPLGREVGESEDLASRATRERGSASSCIPPPMARVLEGTEPWGAWLGKSEETHFALGNVLLRAHLPPARPLAARVLLALLSLAAVHVENDIGVTRVVDVEQVRVELDVSPRGRRVGARGRRVGERGGAGLGGARGRGERGVGEDLHGRVGLGAREGAADGAQDVALLVCLQSWGGGGKGRGGSSRSARRGQSKAPARGRHKRKHQ